MENDIRQLKRNRAKVAGMAFGLLLLGVASPDLGDFFGDEVRPAHRELFVEQGADHAERAFDRAAEMTERAVEMADRAERMAAEAADQAERSR